MKKILIALILATLCLSKGHAQIHAEFGGGIETSHHFPLVKIAAGYTLSNIMAEGVAQVSATRNAHANNYFGVKAGYNLLNIVPSVGYYYNYISADKTELNHTALGYSLKYIYDMNDRGGLYAEATYIEKTFQITAGFHCRF